MADLEKALELASRAHRGQKDRFGEPFILHPLRVMLRCGSETERVVALLHDVVERSDLSPDDLREEGFAEPVVAAVERLTKREGEPYLDYIARVRGDTLASAVKRADLQDHIDAIYSRETAVDSAERLARYRHALALLGTDHESS
jgi:(p)ppGpp synthase/HD superfamily hydrolase